MPAVQMSPFPAGAVLSSAPLGIPLYLPFSSKVLETGMGLATAAGFSGAGAGGSLAFASCAFPAAAASGASPLAFLSLP